MLKDITLGQYFPGNSIAHKLDPRTKILLVTLYIIALFSAKGWMGYAVMAVTLAACVKVSHVGLRALVRGLKPLVFIIAFTGILNMFFTPDTHYLWEWGILRVSVKGIENALFMVIRIMLLVMGTFLMTYTTSPIRLTDGLESLLNPLKKIHVPVHELAMMMAIALRISTAGTSSRRPRRWCPFWYPCLSAPSAGRTSWPRPWSAAATTAARAAPSSTF